jgi:cytochrome b6-f complex iron-sulfur subunit
MVDCPSKAIFQLQSCVSSDRSHNVRNNATTLRERDQDDPCDICTTYISRVECMIPRAYFCANVPVGLTSSLVLARMPAVATHVGAKPRAMRPTLTRSRLVATKAAMSGPVPDMQKRWLVNGLLLGAVALPVTGLAVPFIAFFVPPSAGGGSGGIPAKDQAGNDIKASAYVKTHPKGDYTLAQGLKGDPTYLIVNQDTEIENFGLNAICTHLGCVVPWVAAENKFKCPCHGSQYNTQGKVIRGPAPLSLALAHVTVNDDVVTFSPWTETDFRTDLAPWWS